MYLVNFPVFFHIAMYIAETKYIAMPVFFQYHAALNPIPVRNIDYSLFDSDKPSNYWMHVSLIFPNCISVSPTPEAAHPHQCTLGALFSVQTPSKVAVSAI